jgi:hypothetical protein
MQEFLRRLFQLPFFFIILKFIIWKLSKGNESAAQATALVTFRFCTTQRAERLSVSVQQKKPHTGKSLKKAVNLPQTKAKQHGASR